MELLKNYEEFKNVFRTGKKWLRCREAIERQGSLCPQQFYSIGDSLIYMRTDGSHEITQDFIGHRRYMDIHYYIKGGQAVEIAEKSALTQSRPYSDETDYEFFTGTGKTLTLPEGCLIIIENHEAFRFQEAVGVEKIVFKVTVEANYFLNK